MIFLISLLANYGIISLYDNTSLSYIAILIKDSNDEDNSLFIIHEN